MRDGDHELVGRPPAPARGAIPTKARAVHSRIAAASRRAAPPSTLSAPRWAGQSRCWWSGRRSGHDQDRARATDSSSSPARLDLPATWLSGAIFQRSRRGAVMTSDCPPLAASIAATPNRDPRIRSTCVGMPPRCTCPSTTTRVSTPVRFSIAWLADGARGDPNFPTRCLVVHRRPSAIAPWRRRSRSAWRSRCLEIRSICDVERRLGRARRSRRCPTSQRSSRRPAP